MTTQAIISPAQLPVVKGAINAFVAFAKRSEQGNPECYYMTSNKYDAAFHYAFEQYRANRTLLDFKVSEIAEGDKMDRFALVFENHDAKTFDIIEVIRMPDEIKRPSLVARSPK